MTLVRMEQRGGTIGIAGIEITIPADGVIDVNPALAAILMDSHGAEVVTDVPATAVVTKGKGKGKGKVVDGEV